MSEDRTRAPHLPLAQRRELVLDAALRVALRAPDGVSVDAVAAEAGVAKTVLYRCFAHREDMIRALAEREHDRLESGTGRALSAARPSDDPATAVHRMLLAHLHAVAEFPDSYRLIYECRRGTQVAERIEAARTRAQLRLSEVLAAWLGTPDQAPALAALVVSLSEGAARLLLADPGRWDPRSLAELTSALLRGGIPAVAGGKPAGSHPGAVG